MNNSPRESDWLLITLAIMLAMLATILLCLPGKL